MRSHLVWVLAAVLAGAGCKDPETASRQQKQQALAQKLAEGKKQLAAGQYAAALATGRAASSIAPMDPQP